MQDKKIFLLITGASHTGKTALAQKLLRKYKYPYLSIDRLKMGLIHSGNTALTPMSAGNDLTSRLCPIIVREIIKTYIENKQNLIAEGCYIPFNRQNAFDSEHLKNIEFCCLVMSEGCIRKHSGDIIVSRLKDEGGAPENVLQDNADVLALAQKHRVNYILIEDQYEISIDLD